MNNGKYRGQSAVLKFIVIAILLIIAAAAFVYFLDINPQNFTADLSEQLSSLGDKLPQIDFPSLSSQPEESAPPERTPASGPSRPAPPPIEGQLNFISIDVGQGDCHLLVMPNSKTMLVDAGDKNAFPAIKKYLDGAGIERIDLLVATHPHADHIGSMQDIVENYEIGEIYMPKTSHSTNTYKNLLEAIKDRGKKIHSAIGGTKRFIELDNNVLIRILAPLSDEYEEINDFSVVLHLKYGKTSFLLTGDIEKTSEQEMLEKYPQLLRANVLKIPHHGSSTSSTEAFLDAVSPDFAVIPVLGGNSYNHPHKDVIARLNERQIDYYRTDLFGVIRFSSDGTTISLATERG